MPKLWVIGGPNGAGKSTLADRIIPSGTPIVSPDTIAKRENLGDVAAARAALAERQTHLQAERDFAVDTTFAGASEVRQLRKAIDKGWDTSLIFVGVNSPQIARLRIMVRVQTGGHDVPHDDIDRRFHRSIANFWTAYPNIPEVIAVDNSEEQVRTILRKANHERTYVSDSWPEWFRPPPGLSLEPYTSEPSALDEDFNRGVGEP